MRPTTRLARVTVYGGIALAVAALAFACSLQSDTTGPKTRPLAVTDNQQFHEFQVEKQAQLLPGNVAPTYPEQLRLDKVQGKLSTRFVVDTTGRPLMETFRVIERTDDRFVPSVREAVPNLRFSPAEVGGKKVKQLVEMPFEFFLNNETPGANASVEFSVKRLEPKKEGPEGPGLFAIGEMTLPKMTLPKGVYADFQVERPVAPLPGNPAPRYPDALRNAKVQGEVMAEFIVDERGMVDTTTMRISRATNEEFARSVRASLATFRFSPALVGGRPVKQIVQMPFRFDLSK